MLTPKKLTLADMINQSRVAFSERPSLAFVGDQPITYSQLAINIRNTSGLLLTIGVKKGDRVAILGENSPNWGIAYFAVTSIGAVAVPILPDFSPIEIENILKHSEAKVVFVSARLYARLRIENLKHVDAFIILNTLEAIDESLYAAKENTEYRVPAPIVNIDYCNLEFPSPNEEDLAVIIYTSGTTGRSKGVMLTHRNIISNSISTLKIQNIKPEDRLLSVLPLSHTYECTIGMILPLMSGASVYYLNKPPTPTVLLPALQEVKPTMMLTVPLIIEKIYKNRIKPELTASRIKKSLYGISLTRKLMHRIAAKKLHKTFGGQLHFFGVGGAKLSFEVERFLYEGKFPYSIGYGMTETSPLLSGCTPRIVKFRAAGFNLPGQEMKIDNPNPETGEGEILVKGSNVMVGYYKDAELTRSMFTEDGWLKTGDLGVIDEDGYLYIKGRSKNMILGPSGENIYPEEIEEVINKHDFVLESLVYEMRGKLIAKVHLNRELLENRYNNIRHAASHFQDNIDEYIDELMSDLRTYVNAHVSSFAQLNVILVQAEPFEKTPTQKIKRFLYTH